jgi:hypothetical protein
VPFVPWPLPWQQNDGVSDRMAQVTLRGFVSRAMAAVDEADGLMLRAKTEGNPRVRRALILKALAWVTVARMQFFVASMEVERLSRPRVFWFFVRPPVLSPAESSALRQGLAAAQSSLGSLEGIARALL